MNTLQSALAQQLQKLLGGARGLTRTRPVVPAQSGQTCFVNQCSIKPCVQFVQGGSGSSTIVAAGPGVQAVTPQLAPPGRSTCIRHGNPQTVPAMAHPAVPVAPSVSVQTVIGSASGHRGGVR
jgi:hypothetical protein